jgi:hypothetical protein
MLEGNLNWARVVTVVLILIFAFVGVLVGAAIYDDAVSTHQSRTCDFYETELAKHERAMTICYNDPFCRLQPEDWNQRAFLRAAAPRACAGLPALISTPQSNPMPFTFPPETTAEAQ